MIALIDDFLDHITMYRLVLYVLLGLIAVAEVLSYLQLLPFSPIALLFSTVLLVALCWATNVLLARIFAVPTNLESTYITALILALILTPAQSLDDLPLLGWAAILAISSKYILAFNKKHLFNPAVIAVLLTSYGLGESASWWIGTTSMLPVVLLGGALLVRKLRQGEMVAIFVAVSLLTVVVVSLVQHLSLVGELQKLLVASPLFFFAAVMLTEPLTVPPTKTLKSFYGVIVGLLFVPQIHVGPVYSTPELALVLGNLYAYIVSPKHKVLLTFKRKRKLSSNSVDFVFRPERKLAFRPGQYLELTLAHSQPDSRGNRRFFTLASSPTEHELHLGVRLAENGSSFKRALARIDSRTPLLAGQIAGDFTLPEDSGQKLVFIAGGIGITPFRSMLKYLLDSRQSRDIVVLYANKSVDEIAYQDVLSEAQAKLGTKIFYTLTATEAIPRNWRGFIGRIDTQMIERAVPDYRERAYYISGPPTMVRATERLLLRMQVTRERIKKDLFAGLA